MNSVTVERGVTFQTRPQCDLEANAFVPAEPGSAAIVLLHGGVWNRGERSFFDDRGRALAERGIPAFTVDYRLSGQATFPAALHDVRRAVRWVREDAPLGVDAETVVLCGHSAGAHLAALTAATGDQGSGPGDGSESPPTVDGVVCLDGPYDLFGAEPGSETADFVGCDPTECPERYREASPRMRADETHPPALLYHATDDEWLTARETRAYRDVLALHGVDVELERPPGDHFFFTDEPWFDRTVERTVEFVADVS